eukprot:8975096-Pyramimonas_sp.AAC.1
MTAHGIYSWRAGDYVHISLHQGRDSATTRRLTNRLKANMKEGIIWGVCAYIPTATWFAEDGDEEGRKMASN